MSLERVDEAIRLAANDKASARVLDAYILQTRAGWGNGPLIGVFSTPFARVQRVALAARRNKAAFGANDVKPELVAPEFYVVAVSQKGWPDDTMTRAFSQSYWCGAAGQTKRSSSLFGRWS